MLSGAQGRVDSAMQDLVELFEQCLVDREQAQRSSEASKKAIHKIVVARHGDTSRWRFERRSDEAVEADLSVADFAYRLVELDAKANACDDDEDGASVATDSWIFALSPTFRQEMVREFRDIQMSETPPVKLKAAFGQQCFAIPDARIASGAVHTWDELQGLELFSQLKLRWSNTVDHEAKLHCQILDELEAQYSASTTFKQELVVYLNQRTGSGKNTDISVKYRWKKDEWVLVQRPPIRAVHAPYNIATSNDSAFRVRVYSREQLPVSLDYSAIVDGLVISTPSLHDRFTTTVETQQGFPSSLSIRRVVVRENTNVDWHGLCFTVSYLDANRRNVSLACRLANETSPDACRETNADALQTLVDKMIALTKA